SQLLRVPEDGQALHLRPVPSCTGLLRNAPQLMPGQISAVELPLRPDGRPRSLYVKMYFLPDRSDKSKRRTKTVKRTTEPKWSQTFVYTHVHRRDFRNHMLELTVWDPAQDARRG
ncbi:hypothetical protein CRUP_017701, partial [Coryphaenoides rupestris]